MSRSPAAQWTEEIQELSLKGEYAAVRILAIEALTRPANQRGEAMARFYLGQASIKQSEIAAGLEQVQAARVLFERLGDDRMVVECLEWEATALCIDENVQALTVAREAMRRCRLLQPVREDIEARLHCHIGSIQTAQHHWTQAIRSYQSALRAQDQVRDLALVVRMYNDLSIAHLELGDAERSIGYARRALARHTALEELASVARVENNLGLALIRHGQLDEAGGCLERALRLCLQLNLEQGLSHVLLSFAELHLRQGELDRAERVIAQAAEISERLGGRMTLACARQWLGCVLTRRRDHAGASRAFEEAIALLRDVGVRERLAECHASYAEALEERGDLSAAVLQWKLAMRVGRNWRSLGRRSAAAGQAWGRPPIHGLLGSQN